MSKKKARNAVNLVFASIVKVLANWEKLMITDFGTFTPVEKKPRIAKNPRTGEIPIDEKTGEPKMISGLAKIKFEMGSYFDEEMNGNMARCRRFDKNR